MMDDLLNKKTTFLFVCCFIACPCRREEKEKVPFSFGLQATVDATRIRATVTDTPIPFSLSPFQAPLKEGELMDGKITNHWAANYT